MVALTKLRKAAAPTGKGTPATGEPSRWHTGQGHFPTFGTQKMRRMARAGLGEAGAMAREVSRMSRTQPENLSGPVPRHIVTLEDVTRGLGLEQGVDQRIQRVVQDTLPTFAQKAQTQRIMHARARLQSVLHDSMKHVEPDTRMELLKRAVAYWKRNYQTDYGKEPTVRFRGGEARKSMRGDLQKAGPFYGPRGGKWADAKHTIAWRDDGLTFRSRGGRMEVQHHGRTIGEITRTRDGQWEVADFHGRGELHTPQVPKRYGSKDSAVKAAHRRFGIRKKSKAAKAVPTSASSYAPNGRYLPSKMDQAIERVDREGDWQDRVSLSALKRTFEAHKGALTSRALASIERRAKEQASREIAQLEETMKSHRADRRRSMRLVIPIGTLLKAGPFIGPKGGKWADARHTIPWKEGDPSKRGNWSNVKETPESTELGAKADRFEARAVKELKKVGMTVQDLGLTRMSPLGIGVLAKKYAPAGVHPRVVGAAIGKAIKLRSKADNLRAKASRSRRIAHDASPTTKSMDELLLDELRKGVARGGKYYKRVPTGKPKRPWKYYYTREQYEKDHGATAHRSGKEEATHRTAQKRKAYLKRTKGTVENFKASIKEGKIAGTLGQHVRIAKLTLARHRSSLPQLMVALKKAAPPTAKVKARVKVMESVLGKMLRKPKYKNATALQDLTGARIVCDSIDEVKQTVANLRAKYKIIEEDDYIDTPLGDYRSHHLIIEDGGLAKEIQIRTGSQDTFADWSHNVYKPRSSAEAAAVKAHAAELAVYSKQASSHFFSRDKGEDPPRPPMPPCTRVVKNSVGCIQ